MGNPFQTIQVSGEVTDSVINRIQSFIANAFNSIGQITPITPVMSLSMSVTLSDSILVIDTTQIPGATSSVPVTVILPDASGANGFSFSYKKVDSSSNPIKFFTSATNKQGNLQTINGSASPLLVTAALASGRLFSDGNNWWTL